MNFGSAEAAHVTARVRALWSRAQSFSEMR